MLPKFSLKVFPCVVQKQWKKCFSQKFCPTDLNGKLGILGVPFGKGQKKKGKAEIGLSIAPDFIRKTNFAKNLSSLGLDVTDYGNVSYEPICNLSAKNMHNLNHFVPCAKSVSKSVEKILTESRRCLVLGGDHSIAVGSIHGHMQVADPREVAVVYVDAHADLNTNKTSPSGNVHGMTVALLAKEMQEFWRDSGITGMEWLSPCLSLNNVAYIGTRSVDFGEVNFLCQNDVAVFGIDDIDQHGIEAIFCRALMKIDPFKKKSIHVSFDIDAVDCLEAPCTTAPVRGGLTVREAIALCELLHETGRLSVVDFVEVNAAIGNDYQRHITLDAAKHILLAMFGHCRKGKKIYKKSS